MEQFEKLGVSRTLGAKQKQDDAITQLMKTASLLSETVPARVAFVNK